MNVVPLLDPSARANAEQAEASNPAVSAFVSANAGTGKTKLLIDRLLRLMLPREVATPSGRAVQDRVIQAGADPARIQCLTFTKAAAAEMSIRLQRRLGEWVSLDDAALDRELAALSVPATPRSREAARSLFARVLDLPGGMRIGTIHAFCQSLLRRFPLEAGLSPHFRVVEDADARASLEEAREAMLQAPEPSALDTLAGLASASGFARLVAELQGQRDRLEAALALPAPALLAALRRAVGVTQPDDAAIVLAGAAEVGGEAAALLAEALRVAREEGSPGVRDKASRMLGWLALPGELRAEHWGEWLVELVNDGRPRGAQALVNPKLSKSEPWVLDAMLAEAERVLAVEDERRALRLAGATAALLVLAEPVLRDYAGRKEAGARLDYEDLIGRTSRLLIDPGAAWVLYKLDGGLDHLLLDEVQDTSPAQWQIAGALTSDFFTGEGAERDPPRAAPGAAPWIAPGIVSQTASRAAAPGRGEDRRDGPALRAVAAAEAGPAPRTVFAVGDSKQSIYSFQGADPEEFERWRSVFRDRVRSGGREWRDTTLDVSFRSTVPVLELVDAVFADTGVTPGVTSTDKQPHVAHRLGEAGRVELWPLAPVLEDAAAEPWAAPSRNAGLVSAPQLLANELAAWIAGQVATARLESKGRRLVAGDILVLVRRRNDFARALVRALKTRGVAVAGLDRLVLTDQPAVQDLMALCDALLLPEDDLTLACVLTSPLGGVSDDSLMRLAAERRGSLWRTLRERAAEQPDWAAAWAFLSSLAARADFAGPHALLAEALGPLGGRARLFARLGLEAAEPVDELLGAALSYGRAHPPSLQGFLHWLRQSGAEVKRQAEGAGDAVRIMTVHGAKGLQAPLVVLPDTTSMPPDERLLAWTRDPDSGVALPLWAPRKELHCAALQKVRDDGAAARTAEYNRLLYVALTRAEDRLVVCGWQGKLGVDAACWYRLVERGLGVLKPAATPFRAWGGEALAHDSAQSAPVPQPRGRDVEGGTAAPAWLGRAPDWRPHDPPPEPSLPRPLAPSRPEGVAFGPVPRAASPLRPAATPGTDRFRRGALMHTLLQHLPSLPPGEREATALRHVSGAARDFTPGECASLVREALAVLDTPALAALFGPGSVAEQPLAALVGDLVVSGRVDRMAVLADRVLVADFKTGHDAPPDAQATPVLYLRQMAAYRAVLRLIWEGRPVVCALVWTRGPTVTVLPDWLLDAHAPAG